MDAWERKGDLLCGVTEFITVQLNTVTCTLRTCIPSFEKETTVFCNQEAFNLFNSQMNYDWHQKRDTPCYAPHTKAHSSPCNGARGSVLCLQCIQWYLLSALDLTTLWENHLKGGN